MTDRRLNITRRELLRRAALAGVTAVVPIGALRSLDDARAPSALLPAQGVAAREPLETLTADEARTLDAIVARLIPTDENGPGAREARAARYIDRALGGALASSRDAYRAGLADLDRYARATKSARFDALAPADQDALLTELESDKATGFTSSPAAFFNLVRGHAIQGTFCDPYYGGNANFVGWDLIGYPGVRLAVAPGEQRLEIKPTRVRRSAYDYQMFAKKRPARARRAGDEHDAR